MRNVKISVLLFALFIFLIISCEKENNNNNNNSGTVADSLRINELQVIGSHNSYRLKTYKPIFDFAQSFSSLLPANLNPDGWDYTHLPLEEQFSDYGVRQIEFDIYYDPDGGRFANRGGNQFIGEPVASGIAALDAPGLKMIHIPDLDYLTNYYTFKSGLQTVLNWSNANPTHLPIFVLIEAKEDALGGGAGNTAFAEALPFNVAALDLIDEEIRDIFGANFEKVITPDKVRGSFNTLNEAITIGGWPKVADARGKVIFLLDNGGRVRDDYLLGHPSLSGRIIFVNAEVGSDASAFVKSNDPNNQNIEQLVMDGYIIRTRADADTKQARTGDVSNRNRAMISGAQLISTDYYRPDPRYVTDSNWTDYKVSFENGEVARLNPVNGPVDFVGGAIE